ncbi:MAG: molecular chaperone HtpG [Oscillospiraceae bacterium]|nr:molecular chaperone HtpG [Oscillospiraceae bacterium]
MAKKQFKAESKRLLDMMIHSIYTHQEIFLRELISNASDAIDKLAYQALTDQNVGVDRDQFAIQLAIDKDARTLTVSDNGIGMSKEELENNLGTIARSGSLQFKEQMEKQADIDIIGQFGVGFYSAFMVADTVTVVSKKYGAEEAWHWESAGVDGYTVEACEKDAAGTVVTLKLKEDTDDEHYSKYLETYELQQLVKKYSDYIRYPVKLELEKSRKKAGTEDAEKPEYETYTENTVLNSRIPIWQRNKADVTDEEYARFYQEKFHDYEAPLATIHVSVEGAVTYKALLFIPARLPFDYNAKEFKKELQLYSSGVMIMENCEELLPNHLAFVKGVVDSQDLSLNISRELLQHDRQLKMIASNLDKKVRAELSRMLKNEREKYETLWNAFGRPLKYGIVENYGVRKEELQDLLLFYSAKENKLVTLQEYADAMGTEQKYLYFASGENRERIAKLPQMEQTQGRGYDVLLFTDPVDEFLQQTMREFKEKEFRNIATEDLGLLSEEEKKAVEEKQESDKALLDFVQSALDGKVKKVTLSATLGSHAVALKPDGGISFEMEKYFQKVNPGMGMKADQVLELNPDHAAFAALRKAKEEDPEKAKRYALLLYSQALLIADMPLGDPTAFADMVCGLME